MARRREQPTYSKPEVKQQKEYSNALCSPHVHQSRHEAFKCGRAYRDTRCFFCTGFVAPFLFESDA